MNRTPATHHMQRPTIFAAAVVALPLLITPSHAYVPLFGHRYRQPRLSLRLGSSPTAPAPISSTSTFELKESLLRSIANLRTLQERDGTFSIDFGVKGGELNSTSRAPRKVDYFAISDDVGNAANEVFRICDSLAAVNPLEVPTAFLGDKINGTRAPLDGTWKSLFTTAADASFDSNSTRGAATAMNIVDAKRGRITNVIDFKEKEDGSQPVLKQLNVVISATPVSSERVELRFRYAKAVLTKFFFLPLFGRKLALYIPVPGPFITRILTILSRLVPFRRKKGQRRTIPKAFFDVLYLDDELRIHRTGEDNLFVQVKDTWDAATPLLQ